MEDSRELIVSLKERGHTVVLASSAKQDEVEAYLDLLGAWDSRMPGRRPPTSSRPSRRRLVQAAVRVMPIGRRRSWWGTRRGT